MRTLPQIELIEEKAFSANGCKVFDFNQGQDMIDRSEQLAKQKHTKNGICAMLCTSFCKFVMNDVFSHSRSPITAARPFSFFYINWNPFKTLCQDSTMHLMADFSTAHYYLFMKPEISVPLPERTNRDECLKHCRAFEREYEVDSETAWLEHALVQTGLHYQEVVWSFNKNDFVRSLRETIFGSNSGGVNLNLQNAINTTARELVYMGYIGIEFELNGDAHALTFLCQVNPNTHKVNELLFFDPNLGVYYFKTKLQENLMPANPTDHEYTFAEWVAELIEVTYQKRINAWNIKYFSPAPTRRLPPIEDAPEGLFGSNSSNASAASFHGAAAAKLPNKVKL